ncbi:uncharacterized protein LOC101853090 [Aplysia californica]|uniref:Uncharacterized protein LOC101853090 n=1 Tax=Aplysia californica TaxID=6500 RepID=A0ABM0JQQ9_APLCA|nr:uncharacterized protein LOC101853090 [Aplysia californica]
MRYFFVRPTARGAQTFDCRSTLIIIVVTFIGSALLFIPNWLVTGIKPCYHNRTGNVHWHLKTPTFGQEDGDFLHTLTFFVYPIAGKIIPITLISIFGGLLLHTLRDADQRSRRLRGGSGHGANNNGGNNQTRRTTIMLLAIIALYIISELPQSILLLLCIFVKEFFLTVYTKLGDFVDLLSLINSAINFITYIAMSTQFRNTLIQMSCACLHTSTCHKCGKTTALQSTKYSKAPPTSV